MPVQFPDVSPTKAKPKGGFNMVAGDFLQVRTLNYTASHRCFMLLFFVEISNNKQRTNRAFSPFSVSGLHHIKLLGLCCVNIFHLFFLWKKKFFSIFFNFCEFFFSISEHAFSLIAQIMLPNSLKLFTSKLCVRWIFPAFQLFWAVGFVYESKEIDWNMRNRERVLKGSNYRPKKVYEGSSPCQSVFMCRHSTNHFRWTKIVHLRIKTSLNGSRELCRLHRYLYLCVVAIRSSNHLSNPRVLQWL